MNTFNYFGKDYLQFEKDFTRYYIGKTPLTFIADDLEKSLNISENNYFILPAAKSKDKKPHRFYFDVVDGKYVYKGHD